MIDVTCQECGAAVSVKPTGAGTPRVPRGWKRIGTEDYCGKCWAKKCILRSVTIPVVGPVGQTWAELRDALADCWQWSTQLANWGVTELAKTDVLRSPDDDKMPAMPFVYLYPQARSRFPSMPSKAVATILQTVQRN